MRNFNFRSWVNFISLFILDLDLEAFIFHFSFSISRPFHSTFYPPNKWTRCSFYFHLSKWVNQISRFSFHLSLLEMSEPDFHFTFQTSKDKTSSFDNDLTPNVLRGVEMDVSPFWLFHQGGVSLVWAWAQSERPPHQSKKWRGGIHCSAVLVWLFSTVQCSAVPTCDKSGFGPPPPFAPGPPLYSSSGKAGALCNQHTEKKTHNKLSPADFDTPQIILQVRLAITQISCPCSWCAPPFRGMPVWGGFGQLAMDAFLRWLGQVLAICPAPVDNPSRSPGTYCVCALSSPPS